MAIAILPPHINKSGLKFTPEATVAGIADPGAAVTDRGYNAIRYGLAAIKHVGETAMRLSIEERERAGDYKSLEDFCGRLGSRIANRKMLESLVKAGAFDFTQCDRAELYGCIDDALACSAAAHRDRAAGQVSLFDETTTPMTSMRKRAVMSWSEHEKLFYEKELLGFYVSGHPLDSYAELFAGKNYQAIASLGELDDRALFKTAGVIVQVEKKFTRKEGKPFAVVWIEDLSAVLEVVIWNDAYVKVAEMLAPGRVIELHGSIDTRGDAPRATAQKLKPLHREKANGAAGKNERSTTTGEEAAIWLRFSPATTPEELHEVHEILARSPGPQPVRLLFDRTNGSALHMDAGADLRVELTRELEEKLARWLLTSKPERRETTADRTIN